MSTNTRPENYDVMLQRVRDFKKQSKQASAPDATDPRDQGTATAPKTDGDDASKILVPAAGKTHKNEPGNDVDGMPARGNVTNPGGGGENAPKTTADGSAKDKGTTDQTAGVSSMTPTSKSAADRVKALMNAGVTLPAAGGAPAAAAAPSTKAAGAETAIDIGHEDIYKVGSFVIGNEELLKHVMEVADKENGIKAANDMLARAMVATQVLGTQAAQAAQVKQAADQEDAAVAQALNNASPQERAVLDKMASAHGAILNRLFTHESQACAQELAILGFNSDESRNQLGVKMASVTDVNQYNELEKRATQIIKNHEDRFEYLKAAAMQGAEDAAAMQDTADPSTGEGGEIPGGGDQPDPQQLVELIQSLVQAGEISPEEAQQVMQVLQEGAAGGAGGAPGGDAGGAPGGGLPPEAMAAAGAPEEDPTAKAACQLTAEILRLA